MSADTAAIPHNGQPMRPQRPPAEKTYAFYDDDVKLDLAAEAQDAMPGKRVRVVGVLRGIDPETGRLADHYGSTKMKLIPVRGWQFRVYAGDDVISSPPDMAYEVFPPKPGHLDDWQWDGLDEVVGPDAVQRLQAIATVS